MPADVRPPRRQRILTSTVLAAASMAAGERTGSGPGRAADELGWLREALALNAEDPDGEADDDLEPLR